MGATCPSTARVVALMAVTAVVSSCAAAAPPAPTPPDGFAQHFMTRDGADVTRIEVRAAGVRVTAPRGNVGANSRTIFHRSNAPTSRDHASCVTARHSGLPVQEGVALRVGTRGGTTRAITVMKNIWGSLSWIYNVHTWDTSRKNVYEQVSGHDMAAALSDGSGPPRLCARVVGGAVQFKVWRTSRSEPAWGDAVHTRSVELPKGWTDAGRPGWYIGHVPPGGWAELTGLDPAPAPAPPAPTTTTTTTTTSTTTTVPHDGDEPAPGPDDV